MDCFLFARSLIKKIRFFLEGKSYPFQSPREREELFGVKVLPPRSKKTRANRFIQMLHTVNGVIVQKYLAYPEIEWNWQRFDNFTLGMLDLLIKEEFLDGEFVSEQKLMSVYSPYARIKEVRQEFKQASSHDAVPDLIERYNQENDYVGQIFSQEYRKYSQEDKGNRELRIRGTLSQTRPAGTPPQVVYLRSRLKFLKTVTDKPEPMTSGQRRLIQ
jgi:hypothetical protein